MMHNQLISGQRRFACGCIRAIPNSGGLGDWIESCDLHALADLTAEARRTFPKPRVA